MWRLDAQTRSTNMFSRVGALTCSNSDGFLKGYVISSLTLNAILELRFCTLPLLLQRHLNNIHSFIHNRDLAPDDNCRILLRNLALTSERTNERSLFANMNRETTLFKVIAKQLINFPKVVWQQYVGEVGRLIIVLC